jgi:NADPH:quinone reductase-like Zn-dependent oxidoreductase
MRALQIKTFGKPGLVLELVDLPEPPPPHAGQVLIGVEHAPINMNDLYLIEDTCDHESGRNRKSLTGRAYPREMPLLLARRLP